MKDYFLSVIIPVYNSEHYLDECICSIIKQSYKNFEVLLVDDGSTDSSKSICLKYCSLDSRFKYLQKKNGGAASARNFGLNECKGDLISFIDSDDFIESTMFEDMIKAIVRYKADIVICGRFKDYDNKRKRINCMKYETSFDSQTCLCKMMTGRGMDFSPCDKIYRKDLWDQIYFPEGITGEDIMILPDIFDRASTIIHVGKPLYHYRYTPNSVTTSRFNKHTFDTVHAITKLSDKFYNGNFFERCSLQAFITIQYNYFLQKLYTIDNSDILSTKYRMYLKKNLLLICINPYIKFKTKLMTILLMFPALYKKKYN